MNTSKHKSHAKRQHPALHENPVGVSRVVELENPASLLSPHLFRAQFPILVPTLKLAFRDIHMVSAVSTRYELVNSYPVSMNTSLSQWTGQSYHILEVLLFIEEIYWNHTPGYGFIDA